MKRVGLLLCLSLLLTGCGKGNEGLEGAMSFRDKLLEASECIFTAVITADYGDEVHTFTMDTTTNAQGDLSFTVIQPESISGITGEIRQSGARLTFDDTALAFPLLADGQLSPVSAPWVMMQALRSGYISCVGREGPHWRVTVMDSYEDDALTLDVWMDEHWIPIQGQILFKNETILTIEVEDFTFV